MQLRQELNLRMVLSVNDVSYHEKAVRSVKPSGPPRHLSDDYVWTIPADTQVKHLTYIRSYEII
jgi:hypothetical protein